MSWRRDDLQPCVQLTDAAKDDLRAGGQEGSHPSFSQRLQDELADNVTASAERDRADKVPGCWNPCVLETSVASSCVDSGSAV